MLKESGRVKVVVGNTQPTLEADRNESYLVRAIRVFNPATNYATVKVDRATVAFYRVAGTQGNQLFFPNPNGVMFNLMEWLIKEGIFRPLPVATGQTLSIEGCHHAGSVVEIVYDVFDASDILPSLPNGSDSTEYDYINYGRFNTTLAAGENLFDTQQSPKAFPAFPFNAVVPAKTQITLHGFTFSAVDKDTGPGVNQQRTTFVKLVVNRTAAYDEDMQGFVYLGGAYVGGATQIANGQQHAGGHSNGDLLPPKLFSNPMILEPGDDIDLYVTTAVDLGAANILAADAEVGLILTAKRV